MVIHISISKPSRSANKERSSFMLIIDIDQASSDSEKENNALEQSKKKSDWDRTRFIDSKFARTVPIKFSQI